MLNPIDIVDEINDNHVYLRKIRKDDSSFLFNSLKHDRVNLYLSLGPLFSVEHSKRLIKSYLKLWDQREQFTYIIELLAGEIKYKIGCVSLWNLSWVHRRAEIGIWFTPDYFNKGFGTTTLNLIKIIGFDHLNLNRLEAHAAIENQNSIKLFEKCGFLKEGQLKQYIKLQDVFHDVYVYSLLKKKKI